MLDELIDSQEAEITRLQSTIDKLRLQRDVLALNWDNSKNVPIIIVYDQDGGIFDVTWPAAGTQTASEALVELPRTISEPKDPAEAIEVAEEAGG